MHTDSKLIRACKRGQKKAQLQLYDKYAPSLMGVSMRYCKTKEDAEDVLQESFMRIFSNIKSLKKTKSLFRWMSRVVINQALRYNHANRFVQDQLYIDDDSVSFEEEVIEYFYQSSCEDILALINQLPRGCKLVFSLYAIDGYKHREIAKMLNISEGTSKSQYLRARKLLQLKIQKKTTKKKAVVEMRILSN